MRRGKERREDALVPCRVHPWILLDPTRRETCPELGAGCGGREILRSTRIPHARALTAASWRRRGIPMGQIAKALRLYVGEAARLVELGERGLRWVEGKTIEDLL